MKRVFVVFFAFFIFSCTSSKQFIYTEPQDKMYPPYIRVLSYNIHYGVGTDKKFDVRRIADVINATHPDIVALQEVERRRARTLWVDEAKKIAHLTGLSAVFEPNITYFGDGEYGNAILSRFPIIRHTNYLIPRLQGSQRGVLKAEISIPPLYGFKDDMLLYFFNTHLEAGKGDTLERVASAHFIEDKICPFIGQPMILAGDFNDLPDRHVMSLFGRVWAIAGDGEMLYTHPSHLPHKQIDYILFHPKDGWEVVHIEVINESIASDHRPILAVLKWRGK